MADSRTIRLFVSSTFSDMKAERNVLQERIFPRLQQHCLANGMRFQAIDLRWGVPEEATKDNRTMRICLRELGRCQAPGSPKPNFLILLGGRYGWRPLPEIIPVDLFDQLSRTIAANHDVCGELLNEWYRRDENAVPPVYELMAREGELENVAIWERVVEKPLLAALATARDELRSDSSLPEDLRRALDTVAIGMSATEQEITIGAFRVDDAADHVHAWFRTINGLPTNPSPPDFDEPDAIDLLNDLKSRIVARIGEDNIHPYSVPWSVNGVSTDDLGGFAEEVYEHLKQVIDAQITGLMEISPDEQEEKAHHDFGEERREGFIGREEPLRAISEYLASGPSQPLAIVGTAGSGKSAIMAEAAHRAREDYSEKGVVLARFIGATPSSSNTIDLLRELVRQIRQRYPRGVKQEEDTQSRISGNEKKPSDAEIISEDINNLTSAFHEGLSRATAERPFWLFLDALDQFQDTRQSAPLAWLPTTTPEGVRIVVSSALPSESGASTRPGNSTPGQPLLDPRAQIIHYLEFLAPGAQTVHLTPLTVADGATLLDQWLAKKGRRLQDTQRRLILDAFAVKGNALWLHAVAEEAERWPSGHEPETGDLPATLPDLLLNFLMRLSRHEEHGAVFVRRALGYIASARYGLAEDELIGVLGIDLVVMNDVIKRSPTERTKPEEDRIKSLPVAIWIRFHGDIGFYLTEFRHQGANLLGFYHRSFAEAVRSLCLNDDAFFLALHENMASWFSGQDWFLPPAPETGEEQREAKRGDPANARKASELPLHLYRVADLSRTKDRWGEFVDVLCELDCIETKVRTGLIRELMNDYSAAFAALPEFIDENKMLAKRDSTMITYSKALRKYSLDRSVWLQAKDFSEIQSEPMYPPLPPELQDENERAIPEEISPRASRLRHYANFVSVHLKQLVEFPQSVLPLAINWTDTGPVLEQAKQKIHAYKLHWLQRLPRPSAYPFRPQCLVTLDGHSDAVTTVSFSPDGRRALSGSRDNTIRLWDLESGQCLRILQGHGGWIETISISPDGRRALSGSRDNTLRLWDLESGRCFRTLKQPSGAFETVFISPDGRRALTVYIKRFLRLWELQPGGTFRTLIDQNAEKVTSVSISPDRQLALSVHFSSIIWSMDLESGQFLEILEGQSGTFHSESISPDGLFLLSESIGEIDRLWQQKHGGSSFQAKEELYGNVVTSVFISPDGRRALSAHLDHTIRLWDLESGQCLRFFEGHSGIKTMLMKLSLASFCQGGGITRSIVSISPDGRRAISGSSDKTLLLWDLESGQGLRTLEGHSGSVNTVCISPDGRRAISGSSDKTLRLWDLESSQCLSSLEGHSGWVETVCISPNGRRALSGSYDGSIRLWDLESSQIIGYLEGHNDAVTSVNISPDGRRVLSGSPDETIRLWDLESGHCLRSLKVSGDWVQTLSISPDGRRILSAGGGKEFTLRLWDLESGQCLRTLEGHSGTVQSVSISPDGRHALSSSTGHHLRLWDLESGQCLRTLEGHSDNVNSVRFSPDGQRALSGSKDKTLRLWDLKSAPRLRTLEGHSDMVYSVTISPNGRWALSGSEDKTLRLWDLESGRCLRTLEGHNDAVASVSISPDGRRAISGSSDKTLRLWDLESGQGLRTLEGHSGSVETVCISPNGRRALSGSYDKSLRLWDLESGQCLRSLEGHSGSVGTVCISPDGRLALSGSEDNTLRLWNLSSGQCLRILEGHSDIVASVSITPDGRHALSGSPDETLLLWDLESGQCLRSLEGYCGSVESVSISSDGRIALSGSLDNALRLWDLKASAQCLRTLEGHSNSVLTVSISPDGRYALSGSIDETVRLWDLESGRCLHTLEGYSGTVNSIIYSSDGRYALLNYRDALRLWDFESGQCSPIYLTTSTHCSLAMSPSGDHIVCGTRDGQMHFLTPQNLPPASLSILTAFECEMQSTDCEVNAPHLTASCPYCAEYFQPSSAVVSAIQEYSILCNVSSVAMAKGSTTSKMFEDTRLLTNCPHCAKLLKFNPFFVKHFFSK